MNMLGQPLLKRPRWVNTPCLQRSRKVNPSLPRMFMFIRLPVIASKPVAITIVSNSRSRLSSHLIYQMLYRGIVRRESRVSLQVLEDLPFPIGLLWVLAGIYLFVCSMWVALTGNDSCTVSKQSFRVCLLSHATKSTPRTHSQFI